MTASIARVQVNGIEVGSLPIETYNAIAKNVRKDRRLYLAWVIETIMTALRLLYRFLSAMPSLVVGLFLLWVVVSPDTFTVLLTDLRAADPQAITDGLSKLLRYTFTTLIVSIPLAPLLFPRIIRFQNPFDAALSRQIRSQLEVPTEGELTIIFENSKGNG